MKFSGRRRGISAVLGAVLVFAMVFGPVTAFLIFTLEQSHAYDVASQEAQASQLAAQSENLVISTSVSGGSLTYTFANSGGNPSTVIAAFASPQRSSGSPPVATCWSTKCGGSGHGISLAVGQSSSQITSTVSCPSNASSSDPCSVVVVTDRGRVFSQTYPQAGTSSTVNNTTNNYVECVPSPTQPCVANSAFGLGYISFDFEHFYAYTLSGSGCVQNVGSYPSTPPPASKGCTLSAPSLAYTIQGSGTKYYLFSVLLTNVDPSKRTLMLDSSSFMQDVLICNSFTGCGQAAGSSADWGIGCVIGNIVQPVASCQQSISGSTGIALPYGVPTTVYFAFDKSGNPPNSQKWSSDEPLTPIFMNFHGSLACVSSSTGCALGTSTPFAQNLPYAGTLWS